MERIRSAGQGFGGAHYAAGVGDVEMEFGRDKRTMDVRPSVNGLASWLLRRFRQRFTTTAQAPPRLTLIERIALAPRQSLALVEAEGQRLLIATSAESAPVFYALNGVRRVGLRGQARVS